MKISGSLLISGCALGIFVAVIWLTDPLLLEILVGLVLFPALAFVGVGLVLLLYTVAVRRSPRPVLRFLLCVICVAALAAAAVPVNGFIQSRAVQVALQYPKRVGPALEAHRQQHGAYPTRLDHLPSKPFVPRLLRGNYSYRSDGNSYSFTFPVPGGMIDSWDFSSESGTWTQSD